MGISHNHSEIAETAPAAYIHTQIQDICEAWDTLLQYSKSLLSAIVWSLSPILPSAN